MIVPYIATVAFKPVTVILTAEDPDEDTDLKNMAVSYAWEELTNHGSSEKVQKITHLKSTRQIPKDWLDGNVYGPLEFIAGKNIIDWCKKQNAGPRRDQAPPSVIEHQGRKYRRVD